MTRSFIQLISKTPSVNISKTLLVAGPSEIDCNGSSHGIVGDQTSPKRKLQFGVKDLTSCPTH